LELTPFANLSPDRVLSAAEALGLDPDGRLFALNSYENRVYRVGRHDAEPIVLKFYRADRWSDEQILEEHAFATELAAADIQVVAPIALDGSTLRSLEELRIAAFPLRPGGAPDLDKPDAREMLGRTLARIHSVGARQQFKERRTLTGALLGRAARERVLDSGHLPEHMEARYGQVSEALIEAVNLVWMEVSPVRQIRLHGDCHLGNILWQPNGPAFVDLDDCLNGPAIQDLWMFLSGTPNEQGRQWTELMSGYEQFAHIEHHEIRLIEALRASRMLNHAAWITERWADPAFPKAFPWFGEARYWEQHVNDLAEQGAAVEDPPFRGL
jgi:Ser/Thr protein kinase RdoA (MazF antagonist)